MLHCGTIRCTISCYVIDFKVLNMHGHHKIYYTGITNHYMWVLLYIVLYGLCNLIHHYNVMASRFRPGCSSPCKFYFSCSVTHWINHYDSVAEQLVNACSKKEPAKVEQLVNEGVSQSKLISHGSGTTNALHLICGKRGTFSY